MQQADTALLYKHLQALDMLYRQTMLGDCYVDLASVSAKNTQITQPTISDKKLEISAQAPQAGYGESWDMWHSIAQRVGQCKLCGLSKCVKDSHRSCGIAPTQQNMLQDRAANIAFITESLHFTETNNYGLLNNLEQNRVNEMLFDIIQKVFLLRKECVFILPFFKCVDVADNHSIDIKIRTQSLATERRICGNYLHMQLECVEYAVFFGEHICGNLFETTLQEASGKLLEYYTASGKKVFCVCVPDIMQMLMNPSLKKDAFVNFVLLKNAMCANSC